MRHREYNMNPHNWYEYESETEWIDAEIEEWENEKKRNKEKNYEKRK